MTAPSHALSVRIEDGALVVGRFYARPFFRWYDLWIGAYWDRPQRILYVCPLPMVGVYFGRADDAAEEDDAPYVCPGCYAVGGERCAPGCIDDEIAREAENELEMQDRWNAEEDSDA